MISGFLTSVISSLRPRQHIEERLTRILIIDFYHLLLRLFVAKRCVADNRVSTDVDKHARYISEIAT